MTKRELIDQILALNLSARPEFLAKFTHDDLSEYLDHLHARRRPRLSGDARRYEKYFNNSQTSWVQRRAQAATPQGDEAVHATVAAPDKQDQAAESSFAEESEEGSNGADLLF